jgi:glucarate dehydratase
MKIVEMRVTPCRIPLHAPLRHGWGGHPAFVRIIVELVADNGLVGLGETYGEPHRLFALENAKGVVVGADPYQLERLRWKIMNPGQVKLWLGPIAYNTYAAIEFACLDLIGQHTGRPVHDLLGGKLRERIPQSAYFFYRWANADGEGEVRTPDQLVAHAQDLVNEYGFTSLKFKNGVFHPHEEVEAFIALRAAFPSMKIRMDPNGSWSIGTSVDVSRRLRDHDIEYLEDPTWTLRALSRVAKQAPWQVLASNQAVFSFEDLAPNQAAEAIDVVLADPHWYGGLNAVKVLGRMAETYGFDLGMHSGAEFGISQAVQLHACAAVPNLGSVYASDTHYPHLVDDVITGGKLQIVDGCFEVPTAPGLGVTLDPDKVAQYHELYLRDGFQSWTEDPSNADRVPIIPKW